MAMQSEGRGYEMHSGLGETRHLSAFYAGSAVPCPVGCGGASQVVRVGTLADGGGDLWLECSSCAQRGRYAVPVATSAERAAVALAFREGQDTTCPRHTYRPVLQRRGRHLVCPDCGVRYRE